MSDGVFGHVMTAERSTVALPCVKHTFGMTASRFAALFGGWVIRKVSGWRTLSKLVLLPRLKIKSQRQMDIGQAEYHRIPDRGADRGALGYETLDSK